MSSTLKIILTVAVALAGIGFLAYESTGDVEYYAHVDEVLKDPKPWLERRIIQVHGFAHKVPRDPTLEGQMARRTFELESNGKTIHVVHAGAVPDTFKEEAETVVKGTLTRQADGGYLLTTIGGEQGIMAKCPSKYDGKK